MKKRFLKIVIGIVLVCIVVRLVAPFHTERSPIWTLSEKIVFTQGSQ